MLIKFCGMTCQEDLDLASDLHVNFCGFILHPASPRYIVPEKISALNSHGMLRTGIFVNETSDNIKKIASECRLDFIQLHGNYTRGDAKKLGMERIIKVFWPERYANIFALQSELESWTDHCAMFLLDAGTSGGGHNQTLNWRMLNQLHISKTWLLAGGLSVANLQLALNQCSPAGLDFNSGLENAPGQKDPHKMRQIINQLYPKE